MGTGQLNAEVEGAAVRARAGDSTKALRLRAFFARPAEGVRRVGCFLPGHGARDEGQPERRW